MSSDSDEKRPRVRSSFTRALEQLSRKKTLETIQEKAQKAIGQSDVYICESTSKHETDKLFFVVKTLDEDEEKLTTLGRKLEKLHGHADWLVVREQSETPQQFSRMYQNLTLLSPKNLQHVQAFVEQCNTQDTQLQSESKKSKSGNRSHG